MDTGNIANHYIAASAALKFQMNQKFSLGLLYDQPFGADAEYPETGLPAYTNKGEHTYSKVHTENLSTIVGYQPNKNWNLYTGLVIQDLEAETHTRGAGFGWMSYDMISPSEIGLGWLVGVAYNIPEKAISTSITYRSEVDHKVKDVRESIVVETPVSVIDYGREITAINMITPQSINIDLQTVIMKGTVAFANLRWVDWNKNNVQPTMLYNTTQALAGKGIALVSYYDDQYSANIGIGKKLSNRWGVSVSAGCDSGVGEYVSSQGPVAGSWNAGFGFKYNPQPYYDISLGVKYFWLGDAKSQAVIDFGSDKYDAQFKNNNAWAYGLKIGYRF